MKDFIDENIDDISNIFNCKERNKMFEDKFTELQMDMIDICEEYSCDMADKIFIYVSFEGALFPFHFYCINNRLFYAGKLNKAGVNANFDVSVYCQRQVIAIIKEDAEEIKSICAKYNKPVPTEMRIVYEPKTKKLNAEYKYEKQFTDDMGLSNIVNDWFEKEQVKLEGKKESQAVNAIGWKAIQEEFLRVYPNQTNPKHYGTIIKRCFGGSDVFDGISIYDGGDFWHFVTFGLTELYEKEYEDKSTSGKGYELTFKLKKGFGDDEEAEIRTVCSNLQKIATHVFDDCEVFSPDEYIYTGQTQGIDANHKSKLTGFITVKDPSVETLDTPNGKVEFLELVGMTDEELKTLSSGDSVREIYKKLGSDITDYARDSVV